MTLLGATNGACATLRFDHDDAAVLRPVHLVEALGEQLVPASKKGLVAMLAREGFGTVFSESLRQSDALAG